MRTMQNPHPSETELPDPADVADDIYAYELETARRATRRAEYPPSPSTLAFDPQLSEFTD